MKKIFVSIALIGVLMVTGCTSSKETKEEQEQITVVYCSDCGEESNEVTKFCSGCGVEAKWISEKPEIEEVNKENEETEKTDEEIKNTDEVKIEKDQCLNCGKYFDKNELKKFYEGLLCNTCYNLPKTCENGFVGLCEGCDECEPENNFTYEQAYELAKQYWELDNATASESVYGDSTPQRENGDYYYTFWLRDPEMIAAGGTGTLSTIKVYSNGYIDEI